MRQKLMDIVDEACAVHDKNTCELNTRAVELQEFAAELQARQTALDEREAALNERAAKLAKSEAESNLVQIRQIAAQRLAKIKVLEENIEELKSKRQRAGEEKAQVQREYDRLKASVTLLQPA